MKRDRYNMISDTDGVIIFDESDDYVPEEVQILDEQDELDFDYILNYEKKQLIQERDETLKQRWVSAGVIVFVSLFIAGIFYYNFKDILF